MLFKLQIAVLCLILNASRIYCQDKCHISVCHFPDGLKRPATPTFLMADEQVNENVPLTIEVCCKGRMSDSMDCTYSGGGGEKRKFMRDGEFEDASQSGQSFELIYEQKTQSYDCKDILTTAGRIQNTKRIEIECRYKGAFSTNKELNMALQLSDEEYIDPNAPPSGGARLDIILPIVFLILLILIIAIIICIVCQRKRKRERRMGEDQRMKSGYTAGVPVGATPKKSSTRSTLPQQETTDQPQPTQV